MTIDYDGYENNYLALDELRPLLELIWDGRKVEVKHGHLHVDSEKIHPKNYGHIPAALAKLLDTPILMGVNSKNTRSKVDSRSRKPTVTVTWNDCGKGYTVLQFFNDTAIRRGANKKDTGSSKNGMLYKSFVKITKTIPARASRLSMRLYVDRLVTGKIVKFGCGGYKLINRSVENFHISHENILAFIPHEFTSNHPQVKHVKRTYSAQYLHTINTEPMHNELLTGHNGRSTQPFQSTCNNKHKERTTLKELNVKGYYNKHTDDLDFSNGHIQSLY